jgi:hypothetical protein
MAAPVLWEVARVELSLRYAPEGARVRWTDSVFDETFRWCDAVDARATARGVGGVWHGWYGWPMSSEGVMTLVLRGPDPQRLWDAIEPVVDVLPVLEWSEAWIRQGVAPGVRDGPPSRMVWQKGVPPPR